MSRLSVPLKYTAHIIESSYTVLPTSTFPGIFNAHVDLIFAFGHFSLANNGKEHIRRKEVCLEDSFAF
jgi:hypothetical protein